MRVLYAYWGVEVQLILFLAKPLARTVYSASRQVGFATGTRDSTTPLQTEQKTEWTPQPPPGNEPRIVCSSSYLSQLVVQKRRKYSHSLQ